MSKLDDLAATVQELATPGTKAKEIIAAVRERHPGVSKKDVVQAAFYALTGGLDADPEKAKRIQDLAIAERTSDEKDAGDTSRAKKPKAKRRVKSEVLQA
ncbi:MULTISPECIES: hypothetical protein [unclassified Aureimonas]|uniref:hypothetical protein n=1 Tax=unclassified Aureimonas TaxID=2615206 RepID=UPI0006F1D7B6|nr:MULTISPECIES: hypothetical protein [unclassified Aureimonas]KQT62596.1 hypothetical protein ASG62_23060 [Aureimonas sp. Leaf427]KQT73179.1 hypothetical protein ASG54_17975 [Aureimonas sp. Leaf460]